jgi:H/ACA ribonucleoprotein complex subunit 2
MGKDKSEKKDKKEKKEKKRSETDGVHKSKKEKKEKKLSEVAEKELTAQVLEGLEQKDAAEEVVAVNGEVTETPIGALVPFANPLAEDKTAKKVFKTVKKGASSFPSPKFISHV